jgi:TRAP transporter 4TM/12TM fusion protein
MFYKQIAASVGYIKDLYVGLGIMLIIAILYTCYQQLGKPLVIVASTFIVYALFGQHLPSFLGHRGYSFSQVSTFLFTNANGIFGVPVDVAVRYIVLFMILSELITKSGTDNLFIGIAKLVAKKSRGGAAKSSIVASALFGTIAGSPISNVMVTGAFTIPMMKQTGFKSSFAAAVEATASTGGLITPPIMGSAAFIMAELLGVPYTSVMKAAIIPAIFYFLSLYVAIDIYAVKSPDIKRLDSSVKEEIDTIIRYIHTIIPLTLFIGSVMMGYSVFRGAIIAILITPIIAYIRPYTRMSIKDFLDCIKGGMLKTVKLGSATATAGIIVGIIALTGFGFSFSQFLQIFAGYPFLTLMITALLCIVIGMGMPMVASYLIVATITVPALISFGFLPIAAHFFIFYFTAFSSVTPPVALATYSSATLAGSDPWETGLIGFKLASVAFLAPFIFIYSPTLLGQESFTTLIPAVITALIGIYMYVCGMHGYFMGFVNKFYWRILLIFGGILMIVPHFLTDGISIIILIVVFLFGRSRERRVSLN